MSGFGNEIFTLGAKFGASGRVVDGIQNNAEVNVEKTLEEIEGVLEELKKSVESKKKLLRKSSKFSDLSVKHPFISKVVPKMIFSFAF